jgi:hypothetical protein
MRSIEKREKKFNDKGPKRKTQSKLMSNIEFGQKYSFPSFYFLFLTFMVLIFFENSILV